MDASTVRSVVISKFNGEKKTLAPSLGALKVGPVLVSAAKLIHLYGNPGMSNLCKEFLQDPRNFGKSFGKTRPEISVGPGSFSLQSLQIRRGTSVIRNRLLPGPWRSIYTGSCGAPRGGAVFNQRGTPVPQTQNHNLGMVGQPMANPSKAQRVGDGS